MKGPSPTAASASERFTVTANEVYGSACATRWASSRSAANRSLTYRLSSRSPLALPSRTTRWRSRPSWLDCE